jgi:hypothetical protein
MTQGLRKVIGEKIEGLKSRVTVPLKKSITNKERAIEKKGILYQYSSYPWEVEF